MAPVICTPSLSKSRVMSFRQCPKRLWLEIHQPQDKAETANTFQSFRTGHVVGALARRVFDPHGIGAEISRDPFRDAFPATVDLLSRRTPIFEAAFGTPSLHAFADVLLPTAAGWHLIEVKSATSVHDHYLDDVAIQAHMAGLSQVHLEKCSIAHLDNRWVYPGNNEYTGIFKIVDITPNILASESKVANWISGAMEAALNPTIPDVSPGAQCSTPYPCGFIDYCNSSRHTAVHPVSWLPGKNVALKRLAPDGDLVEMSDVADQILTPVQLVVKEVTISGSPRFDAPGALAELKRVNASDGPLWFLDFETVSLAVPVWAGARPYERRPFQFSVHHLTGAGQLTHRGYLDLSGNEPSRELAEALLLSCGEAGAVFAYHAAFERGVIFELADRLPDLQKALEILADRLVDLLPITRRNYYHPDQRGSWSIKRVAPTLGPDLAYEQLDGVADGGAAMAAWEEAVHPDTTIERKTELHAQLELYCRLDTLAMVRLWQFLRGVDGPSA